MFVKPLQKFQAISAAYTKLVSSEEDDDIPTVSASTPHAHICSFCSNSTGWYFYAQLGLKSDKCFKSSFNYFTFLYSLLSLSCRIHFVKCFLKYGMLITVSIVERCTLSCNSVTLHMERATHVHAPKYAQYSCVCSPAFVHCMHNSWPSIHPR